MTIISCLDFYKNIMLTYIKLKNSDKLLADVDLLTTVIFCLFLVNNSKSPAAMKEWTITSGQLFQTTEIEPCTLSGYFSEAANSKKDKKEVNGPLWW